MNRDSNRHNKNVCYYNLILKIVECTWLLELPVSLKFKAKLKVYVTSSMFKKYIAIRIILIVV